MKPEGATRVQGVLVSLSQHCVRPDSSAESTADDGQQAAKELFESAFPVESGAGRDSKGEDPKELESPSFEQ